MIGRRAANAGLGAPILGVLLLGLAGCADLPPAEQRYVVFFPPYSANLDEAGASGVADAAEWAKAHAPAPVVVTGYASPIGSAAANQTLSATRAQVVIDALVKDGVTPGRIERKAVGATAYANDPIEARRVEIAVGGG